MKTLDQKRKTTIKGAVDEFKSETINLQQALDEFRSQLQKLKWSLAVIFIEYLIFSSVLIFLILK